MQSAEGSDTKSFLVRMWKKARWVLLAIAALYVTAVLWNIPWPASKEKTDAAVAAIHAHRLTVADVDGKHLPPEPDAKLVNATVEGVDANTNGIRDDVELAIFKKYPNSPKIRAAELQNAKSIQLEQVSVFNSQTLVAAMQEGDRAFFCVGDVQTQSDKEIKAVEEMMINTDLRRQKRKDLYERFMTSYGDLKDRAHCDVEL